MAVIEHPETYKLKLEMQADFREGFKNVFSVTIGNGRSCGVKSLT